jgi:hypothetical protein
MVEAVFLGDRKPGLETRDGIYFCFESVRLTGYNEQSQDNESRNGSLHQWVLTDSDKMKLPGQLTWPGNFFFLFIIFY